MEDNTILTILEIEGDYTMNYEDILNPPRNQSITTRMNKKKPIKAFILQRSDLWNVKYMSL